MFGAIFANRLASELVSRGVHGGGHSVSPAAIRHLPAAARRAYAASVAGALHPVFLVAAAIAVAAFLLTWLLRETPLRATVRPLDGEEMTAAASEETSPPSTVP
jgi:hypothetical protein